MASYTSPFCVPGAPRMRPIDLPQVPSTPAAAPPSPYLAASSTLLTPPSLPRGATTPFQAPPPLAPAPVSAMATTLNSIVWDVSRPVATACTVQGMPVPFAAPCCSPPAAEVVVVLNVGLRFHFPLTVTAKAHVVVTIDDVLSAIARKMLSPLQQDEWAELSAPKQARVAAVAGRGRPLFVHLLEGATAWRAIDANHVVSFARTR